MTKFSRIASLVVLLLGFVMSAAAYECSREYATNNSRVNVSACGGTATIFNTTQQQESVNFTVDYTVYGTNEFRVQNMSGTMTPGGFYTFTVNGKISAVIVNSVQ